MKSDSVSLQRAAQIKDLRKNMMINKYDRGHGLPDAWGPLGRIARFFTRKASQTWRLGPLRTGALCALVLVLQGTSFGAPAAEPPDHPLSFDIPEHTSLESALIEWGVLAGKTVMINTETIKHLTTSHKIHGTLPARQALKLILEDSGMSYTEEGGRILIVPVRT